jgi:uncharacterized membrane protein YccC
MPRHLLAEVVAFDKTRWRPWVATHCAIGVAVPILIGLATDHLSLGILAAIGALYTGIASYSGVYTARVRATIISGFQLSAAAAIGVLVGKSDPATLITVFVVAFLAAIYASTGPGASTQAAQTTAILIVVSGLGLPVESAPTAAGMILAGSALQAFLLLVVWPLNPRNPERLAVADVFDILSQFMLGLVDKQDRPIDEETDIAPRIPSAVRFDDARAILAQAPSHHRTREHDLLAQSMVRAEGLRAAMVGFAHADAEFRKTRAGRVRANRIARSIARTLHSTATGIRRGRVAEAVMTHLPTVTAEDPTSTEYAHWLEVVKGLLGHSTMAQEPPAKEKEAVQTERTSFWSRLTQIPDVSSLKKVASQHALRYAGTIEIAMFITRYWKIGHGYWFPLTVALVLKQNYGVTFSRAVSRLIGTVAGILLASLTLGLIHPDPWGLGALTIIATWIGFALFESNYAVYTAAVTGFVVFALAATGLATKEIGVVRLLASAAGVALALSSYVFLPAWHWSQVWEALRDSLRAQIAYGETVLSGGSEEEIDATRSNARSLRREAESLVHAALIHPRGRNPDKMKTASDTIQCLEENAAVMLTIEAESRQGDVVLKAKMAEAVNRAREMISAVELQAS